MKLKKIFLTVAIIAVLSLTFVLAVSASEYDFISSIDNSDDLELPALILRTFEFDPSGDGSGLIFKYFTDDKNESVYFRPIDFYRAVQFISGYIATYSDFQSHLEPVFNATDFDGTKYFCSLWMNGYSGCNEEYFNKLLNYTEITQEELSEKNAQIEHLSNLLTQLDNQFYETQAKNSELTTQNENLQSSVDELSGANTKLQYQIDSLEVQVADLVNDKTVINSELMALDAKLEREVAKSYLQGVDDATSFSWTPIVVGLSVVSMLLTIVSLCIRGKKKKR